MLDEAFHRRICHNHHGLNILFIIIIIYNNIDRSIGLVYPGGYSLSRSLCHPQEMEGYILSYTFNIAMRLFMKFSFPVCEHV